MSYSVTKSRVVQWFGIIAVLLLFGGAYWYFQVRASTLNQSKNDLVTDGLVGLWSFNGDDMSGTTAYDRSGNGNNGTLTNGPIKVNGKIGQALSFDGSDDYVTVPDTSAIEFDYNVDFSVSTWVKIPATQSDTSATDNAIIEKWYNSGDAYPYVLRVYNQSYGTSADQGKVTFRRYDLTHNPVVVSKTPLNDNAWHLVTGTKSGSTLSLYVDGALQGTTTDTTTTTTTNATPLFIGERGDGYNRLQGLIDEVRIYNRALSASEIQSLYTLGGGTKVNSAISQSQGTGRLDSGLQAYFPLDENTGGTTTDASTNGATGTLTNGPTWTTGQIGSAVDFDGSNDYITTPDADVLDITDNSNFTLSGWFNRDTFTTDDTILAKSNGRAASDTGYDVYIDYSTDKVTFVGNDGTDQYKLESVSTFTATGWHHYAVVWNDSSASETKLYIDGMAEAATATGTFTSVNSLANAVTLRIGADSGTGIPGNRPFDGKLDEQRLYSRALSADEVSQLYRLGTPTGTDTSLKGYWSFDGQDMNGTTAYDRSGAGNTGTLTNGPTSTIGKIGQALTFDGTDQYADVGNNASLNPSTTMTVSAWFKSSTSGVNQTLYESYLSASSAINFGIYSDNKLIARTNTSASWTSFPNIRGSTAVTDGTWHHGVFVLNNSGQTLTLYLDGVPNGTVTGSAVSGFSPTWNRIGVADGPTNYFSGAIDEVRIYNRALSTSEIQSLYAQGGGTKVNSAVSQSQGTGRLDSGLQAYFPLDENTGGTTTDASTNGATGTLTNGPTWTTGQIGSAVDFDGSNDYITTPDANVLDITDNSNFTLSGWFNRDTFTTDDTILAKSNGQAASDTGYNVYIDDSTDKVTFVGNDGTDQYKLESVSTFTATGWHHYAIVWDESGASQTTLSIDGSAEAATATGTFTSVNSLANAVTLRIGAESDGGNPFDGKLDEQRLYSRALSADEVSQLYRLTSPTAVDTSLKGYWSFGGQDMNGTTAYDRSGSGNNGALTNGPTSTIGKIGQALSFDNADDYVSVASNASLNMGDTDNMTLTGWFYRSATGGADTIIAKRNGVAAGYVGYIAYITALANKLTFEVSDGTHEYSLDSTTTFTTPGWNHFAIVWDQASAANSEIYINGVADSATDTGTISSVGSLANVLLLAIGTQSDGTAPFNGKLDEIRVYKRALSADEIAALYNSSR